MIHFEDLAKAVLEMQWDKLPVVRDPNVPDPDELAPTYTPTYYTAFPTYNKDAYGYSNYGTPSADYGLDNDDPVGPTVYTEEQTNLIDCLSDAKFGLKTDLLELIANFIHPENSDTAMKFLNRNAITEEVILDAEDMLRVGYDEDQVIEYLFDIIYKE